MEKYGFIYLWYDKKRKMFYVGSHWGTETDGYICSSNRMRDAYRRRPKDFKRRIVEKVFKRNNLLDIEYKWLSMISEEELGKKYYNLRKHKWGHWSSDNKKSINVKNKLIGNKNRLGKPKPESEKLKISNTLKGHKRSLESIEKQKLKITGRKLPREQVEKIAFKNKGKKREMVQCPHCNTIGGINAMSRWHLNNCKYKVS